MQLSQSERMQIQVKIMECKALAALNGDDPVLNKVWGAQIELWETLLKKESQK